MLTNVIVCIVYVILMQEDYVAASQAGRTINHNMKQGTQTEMALSIPDLVTEHDPDRHLFRNQTKVNHYTQWSPWSRCSDCQQRRMRKCIHPKCGDSKMYEERSCNKRRCKRKHKRKKQDFHLVHLDTDISHLTKQSHSRIWSKWSSWTTCAPDCRTYRVRYCRMGARCPSKQQHQFAYCYFDGTNCENYILNLLDQNKYSYNTQYNQVARYDYSKYQYFNETKSNRRKPRKHRRNRRCGIPNKKVSMMKIIGGRESNKYKWPWHVAIINKYEEVFCGGTLIAPQWVITAAHCVRSYLRVKFSEHDLTYEDGREIDMKVKKMFPFPGFNRRTVDNDLALLLLPKPVRLPIACLPKRIPKPRKLCSVMGWGKINPNYLYGTPILLEAKLPIVNANVCRRAYDDISITPNMLCAGWRSGKSDTCAGDSGGGLMCPSKPNKNKKIVRYTIQGITSFGDGCGRHNKYGIYTTVFNYLEWIQYKMDHYS